MHDDLKIPDNRPETTSVDVPQPDPAETMQFRPGSQCAWPISRRDFVKGAGTALGASMVAPMLATSLTEAATTPPPPTQMPLSLTVNGKHKQMTIDVRTSLLDLLREELKLTGTKKGCDHGQCGACTVLVNGRRINSCLALAVSYDGAELTTIEGLAKGEVLNPVQQAFLDHDGLQCGYCTPGQIISAVALLEEAQRGTASFVTADLRKTGPANLTEDEIRERMSGNICRCGAYPGIVAAVRQAYAKPSGASSQGTKKIGESSAVL